jgi:hypothetical protein
MDYDTAAILRDIEYARREIAARRQVLVDAVNSAQALIGVLNTLDANLRDFAQHGEPHWPLRTRDESQYRSSFSVSTPRQNAEFLPQGRPAQGIPSFANEEQGIINTYNDAPKALHSRYQPSPFGVVNGNELQRNAAASPIFGDTERGAYLLIRGASGKSYVIPKDDILFQDAYYNNEAMGVVFDCRGYEPGTRYRHIELVRPAIFSNSSGHWTIERKGEIQLSAPDLT